MSGHAVEHTKVETRVVPADGGTWPHLPRDGRKPGLLPEAMTVYQADQGRYRQARASLIVSVHGRNIRVDGSLGARSSRVFTVGGGFGDPAPGWVEKIAAEVAARVTLPPRPDLETAGG